MLFPNTRRDVVKISDFAFSYCLDSRADVGALKQCLPANICPPEVFSPLHTSDSEMCTLANCKDPDEMLHNAAFNQDLHSMLSLKRSSEKENTNIFFKL